MKLFFKHSVFYLSLLILMQACSSSSFTKRQYLSGRYLDKTEIPEKPKTLKTEEFILQKYPLSACDFYFKSNSLPNKGNQLIPDAENPMEAIIKNKNIIISTDSTQVEKKTFKIRFAIL